MGKNYNCLFSLKYQNMIQRIVGATRSAADVVPELRDNKNGCIRITLVPLSQLAEAWLGGGLSDFGFYPEVNTRDVCEREFIYKIHPEGKHTIQFICEDGHTEPVNCYGYSALKVAYASWKRQFDAEVAQKNLPEDLISHEFQQRTQFFVAENGYSMDRGVIYATVTLDDEDFLRMYVTVSGAQKGEDDEQCALAGMIAANDYFRNAATSIVLPPNTQLDFRMIPDFISVQET